MDGFGQLRVMQRLLYKRHFPKGYKEWCIYAKTIVGGSMLSSRMHKECFDSHVQFRRKKATGQSRSCSVS